MPQSSGIYSRDVRIVQHLQINVIYSINKMKNKNGTIISIDAEKTFDTVRHLLMIKLSTNWL